jgi:hypothetical protein
MPLEKGQKKTGGRKKGSLNKKTEVANAFVDYIINKGYKDIDKLWAGLKPKEQMEAITKLIEFTIPKQARIEHNHKQLPNLTVNFLPASPERIAEQNTIDISHEEIESENSD